MNSNIPKQYLELEGKPVLIYSLLAFENSFMDEIVLVTREGDEEYCRKEYIENYHLKKVKSIVAGGAERYLSVMEGLKQIKDTDYIWIHDGARPFLSERLLAALKASVEEKGAVIPGVQVKDTIKQTDKDGTVSRTIPRECLWNIQTPQVFKTELIKEAYRKLAASQVTNVTDDSMVIESMTDHPVTMVEGDYHNIKLTTQEDMQLGELILRNSSAMRQK